MRWRVRLRTGFPLPEARSAEPGTGGDQSTVMQVAVSTQSDQGAAQLISNAYQKMKQLSNKYVAKRANLEFVGPGCTKERPVQIKA